MTTLSSVSIPQVWTLVYDGTASGALVGSVYVSGNVQVYIGTSLPATTVSGGQGTNEWIPINILATDKLYCKGIGATSWAVVDDSIGDPESPAGVATTLQEAYDASTSPEILTDATNGALTLKRGSVADTDLMLDIKNGADVSTTTITAAGSVQLGSFGATSGVINLVDATSGINQVELLGVTGRANVVSAKISGIASGSIVSTTTGGLLQASPNIVIGAAGEVSKPTNPAFNVTNSAQINAVTGDGTQYSFAATSERFDVGSNVASGTFTASRTGKVGLSMTFTMGGLTSAHTVGYMQIITSNKSYRLAQGNPFAMSSGGVLAWSAYVLADMDAGDTAYGLLYIGNGAKVVYLFADLTTFCGDFVG